MTFDSARLLVSSGIVSEEALQRARAIQIVQGGSLPRICHEQGTLDEARWTRVVARALSLPTLNLETLDIDADARAKAPEALLRELAVLPFQIKDRGRVLWVAMAEPQDEVAQAQLRAATGCELEIGVAGYRAIEQALERASESEGKAQAAELPEVEDQSDLQPEIQFEGFEAGQVTHSVDSKPPIAGASAEEAYRLTEELIRRVETLSEAAARSASALRAAVDLCVEQRLFTPDDLRGRVNRKPRA